MEITRETSYKPGGEPIRHTDLDVRGERDRPEAV